MEQTTRHRAGFTLIEMAIVLVIMGLLIGLVLPVVNNFIKQEKKSKASDFVERAKNEIIGFALLNKRLPTDLDEVGLGNDPYGKALFYQADSQLVAGDLCNRSSTSLKVTNYGSTPYSNIAFVVASTGRNVHQEIQVATNNVTIFDPRTYQASSGDTSNTYDDEVQYVSLAYLRNKICTNTSSASFTPPGAAVSLAANIEDFAGTATGIAPPGSSLGTVKVDTDTNTINLGGGVTGANGVGCVWYQGSETTGSCTNGLCTFGTTVGSGDGVTVGSGFRAYFKFKTNRIDTGGSTTYGDGFTFAMMTGTGNTASVCGSSGSYLGYGGTSTYGAVTPPKIGIEFDFYPSGTTWEDGANGYNHVAIDYWASSGRNSDLYQHTSLGDGTRAAVTAAYTSYTPSLSEIWSNTAYGPAVARKASQVWMEDGLEYDVRIEVEHVSNSNSYQTEVWVLDCLSQNCTDISDLTGDFSPNATANTDADPTLKDIIQLTSPISSYYYGWTQGTYGVTQDTTISSFGIKFLP